MIFPEGAAARAVNEAGSFVIAYETDEQTGEISYSVLLEDGSYAPCDENGNFQTALVEVYDVSYTNQPKSEEDYAFLWDGFELLTKERKKKQ